MVDIGIKFDPQGALDALLLGVVTAASAFSGYGLSAALVGRGWAASSPDAAVWTSPFWAPATLSQSSWVRAVSVGLGVGTMVAGLDKPKKKKQQKRKKAVAKR